MVLLKKRHCPVATGVAVLAVLFLVSSFAPAQAMTVSFLGQMASSTSDALALRNFTVIRYPAQANP